ncbi:4Fe-4S dicluster domain-containing protein [Anoxynatronum buryatiense]|uniref:4Fe-4S dicluster domain-containing protein n=1 Tax=Anoxynatronum buryatiense TaxID=489973 RepID=A0AA45WWJ7_9CLOT|nr:4Fe-4S dicluster-binding protein [Anoxynatronum buryatiense]SMP54451.1 4Fe-4S dicluster domain-containing protein [Anoxynatronum buryatiense]
MANHQIIVDQEKCIGCKNCYKSCFVDVIRWDESSKKPIIAYPKDCAHCTYCEAICPVNCIEVVIDFEGERLYQSFDKHR